MTEHILHHERHATKRTVAERGFVEAVDPIGIRFDDGIDRRIYRIDRLCRRQGKLSGWHLFRGHEVGESKRVVCGVFGKFHENISPPQRTRCLGVLGGL